MSLKETLEWFGGVLKAPLDNESQLIPSSETAKAPLYIAPSPTLAPVSRIEIYAQQYWWRLWSILQTHYPLLTRLFGTDGFNETIATPYLLKNPPTHWNINLLGDDLCAYLKTYYHDSDAPLVHAVAELDSGFMDIFIAPKSALPTSENETLYLSPAARLYTFKWDLPEFRKKLLKEDPDYWIDHDFPELKKGVCYFLLRRTHRGDIALDTLSHEEYLLLKEFENGISLSELCNPLQNESQIESSLNQWIPRWIKEGIITPTLKVKEKKL